MWPIRLTCLPATLVVTIASAAVPSLLNGQERDVLSIPDSTLTSYAKAFNEISAIHLEIQDELAAATNKSDEAQHRIRERMGEEVAAILEKHGLTGEQYGRITWMISVDGAHRDRFDAILEGLADDTEGP